MKRLEEAAKSEEIIPGTTSMPETEKKEMD